jgi:hypothetical protein
MKRVLMWDRPPPVVSKEEWLNRSADSAPPGCYTANMSEFDRGRWKAKLVGTKADFPQVEIRKDSTVVVLSLRGYKYRHYDTRQGNFPERKPWQRREADNLKCIHIASAGPMQLTLDEFADFQVALVEGMQLLRDLEDGVVR